MVDLRCCKHCFPLVCCAWHQVLCNPWPSFAHPDNLKYWPHLIHSLNINHLAWYLKVGINLVPSDYCCSPLKPKVPGVLLSKFLNLSWELRVRFQFKTNSGASLLWSWSFELYQAQGQGIYPPLKALEAGPLTLEDSWQPRTFGLLVRRK